jgi:hypothetical protein
MSEHDVAPLAIAAGHHQPVDGRAEGEDLDHGPGLGADRQAAYVASVGHLTEELVLRGVLAHGNILRHGDAGDLALLGNARHPAQNGRVDSTGDRAGLRPSRYTSRASARRAIAA